MSTPGSEAARGDKRRGVGAFFGASVFAQVCALVRYVLLARLLGPEQLGLATILTLAWAFFAAITDSGVERFIVQNRNGDDPALQNLLHGANLLRGGVGSLGLLIVAWPLSTFYGREELFTGLTLLALVPLTLGLVHTDMRRVQRRHDFKTEARATAYAELVSLVAVALAALILKNHLAVVAALLARAVVLVVASHLRAERAYRIGWSRPYASELLRYSLPLMAATSLMFCSQQGDRALISGFATLEQLGHYSAVLLLVYYPSTSIYSSLMVIQLPSLSNPDPVEHAVAADRYAALCVLLGSALVVGFAAVAPTAVPLLFGSDFAQSLTLIALIGATQATRFLSVWPTVLVLGKGKSKLVLAGNAFRLAGVVLAFVSGLVWGTLPALLLGFLIGELIGLTAFQALAERAAGGRRYGRSGMRLVRFAAISAVTLGVAWALDERNLLLAGGLTVGALIPLAAWLLWEERSGLTLALRTVQSRLRRGEPGPGPVSSRLP